MIRGLWDSHVHIFSTPTEPDTALPLYLINGVTGIRDMGALWPIAEQLALQDRIEAGEVLGPRLVLSGASVAMANKMARVVWAVMARGEVYQARHAPSVAA